MVQVTQASSLFRPICILLVNHSALIAPRPLDFLRELRI
jgi:hypothetical protein